MKNFFITALLLVFGGLGLNAQVFTKTLKVAQT
jgi:hypothetical protein